MVDSCPQAAGSSKAVSPPPRISETFTHPVLIFSPIQYIIIRVGVAQQPDELMLIWLFLRLHSCLIWVWLCFVRLGCGSRMVPSWFQPVSASDTMSQPPTGVCPPVYSLSLSLISISFSFSMSHFRTFSHTSEQCDGKASYCDNLKNRVSSPFAQCRQLHRAPL